MPPKTILTPLSQDLRERIVRAVEGDSTVRQAARRFAVSTSAAIKLMQRVRQTRQLGSVARLHNDRNSRAPGSGRSASAVPRKTGGVEVRAQGAHVITRPEQLGVRSLIPQKIQRF